MTVNWVKRKDVAMKREDTEFRDYLRRHYGNPDTWWCMQPPMQQFWFHEDLDQYRSGTFSLTENEEKRCLRTCCLILAECADEMYREDHLYADEIYAIYNTLSGIYMNRTTHPAECFIPVAEEEVPFE